MDEPRTHYQLSFTSRQALLLFVGLLVALGIAYTLGVLTGLAGREAAAAREPSSDPSARAAAAVTPEPTGAPAAAPSPDLEVPKPVRGVSPRPIPGGTASTKSPGSVTRISEAPAAAAGAGAAAPSPSPGLQLFEDEGGPPPTKPTARPATKPTHPPSPAAAPPSSSAFWVQALSASSSKEAKARRDRLAAHGYSASVVPGEGPNGSHVYRVRVGPYKTREEADRAAAKLKATRTLPAHPTVPSVPVAPAARPPDWIRERRLRLADLHPVKNLMRRHSLSTVCEEARCPNRGRSEEP